MNIHPLSIGAGIAGVACLGFATGFSAGDIFRSHVPQPKPPVVWVELITKPGATDTEIWAFSHEVHCEDWVAQWKAAGAPKSQCLGVAVRDSK